MINMDKIQQQEAKIQKLRIQWKECTSVAYRDFIKVSGLIEVEKLERMREKEEKSADEPQNSLL